MLQDDVSPSSGNALQACVASILEMELATVPNFIKQTDYLDALNAFLAARGLCFLKVDLAAAGALPFKTGPTLCVAAGPSPRGDFKHAVVARVEGVQVVPVHDPHPQGGMLAGPAVWAGFFVALEPARLTPEVVGRPVKKPRSESPGAFIRVASSATTPRLALGLAALGRPGYINLGRGAEFETMEARSVIAMRARTWEVLDAAWRLGVRWFDCARSYGQSEQFLADWLAARGYDRDDVAVSSKWGYRYTADWRIDTGGQPHEVKDHSLKHLQSQLVKSDELIGKHLRLYQIHSATLESGVLDDAAVLECLAGLKEKKGWRIGLSLSGVKQKDTLEKALRLSLFDSVQATWNLLEQSAGDALLKASEAGLQVIVKEALANGRVLRQPALQAAAARIGATADALALAAVMAQPFKPSVLSGAATAAQLESNVAATALAERFQSAEGQAVLASLMKDLRTEPVAYWAERSALAWN